MPPKTVSTPYLKRNEAFEVNTQALGRELLILAAVSAIFLEVMIFNDNRVTKLQTMALYD